jgi:polyhydroxyalkanoate synthase subunit PhaC
MSITQKEPRHLGPTSDSSGSDPDLSLVEQGHQFAQNMTRVLDVSGRLWHAWLDKQLKGGASPSVDPLNSLPTFAELARVMWDNPQEVADLTLEYWTAQQALWQNAVSKWLGSDQQPDVNYVHMQKPDKRFAHHEWSENALFDYLKQNYLLTAGFIQNAVGSVGEMDAKDRKKAALLTRNFVEALNPANFFALNPEVLEATLEEKGENLVRGLTMMLEDLERGNGQLLIRQTDLDAFEVGVNTAISPGAVIWQNEILQVIQYAPKTDKVFERPLLFIPPWINKYYVLDLNEKKSMVKWLVEQGYTVFMVSWVNPDERHRNETWDDYMFRGASAAIDVVLKETGQKDLNLVSYCIGGTLAGTLSAYMSKVGDNRLASSTFFTAQLNFEDAGELQCLVDDHILDLMDTDLEKGYLPAQRMSMAFNLLRANDLIWGYVVNNYLLGKDPFPFDLLYWNSDSTAMPAKVHQYYLKQFYIENNFAYRGLTIKGQHISLADIEGPVYHLAAKEDHIAPANSVYRGGRQMKKADLRFVVSASGHIAGVVNPPAANKYQFWTNANMEPETLSEWLDGAEEVAGSWWVDWDAWLRSKSGDLVAAREPGVVHGVLEPAPGSYVRKRS